MQFKPHDYQKAAIDYVIENPEAALFLEMGLGKTIITLTALHELILDRFEVSRALVVAPLRVARDTWPQELAKWEHLAGLTMAVAVGTQKEREAALATGSQITVINRENVPWLVKHLGKEWPFDTVIIDELSSFKNHQAKRFRALRAVRHRTTRFIGLTGTPAANGLLDLWAQFRLLDGGERLGKYITHYRNRFFQPDKRNGMQVYSYKPLPGAEEGIYKAIGDITMSLKTDDHLTMPPLTFASHEVRMDAPEKKKYDQLKKELVLEIAGQVVDAANAAVLSAKLLQLASGTVYDEAGKTAQLHDRKLDALEDLIESANGQTLLVAYWFKADLARLLERFPQATALKTSENMTAWNRGEIPVGLIHPASAGHGLNLQAGGHHLVWLTPTWSLELYQQTNARLYRQGQESPVVIHHLVTKDTLDSAVLAALERKDSTQTALIDAVKTTLKGNR